MEPGFCISTNEGRDYLRRVQEASTHRAHIERVYWASRECLKSELLKNQYNSRNSQYDETLRLLRVEYNNIILAIHYEPILGNVKWQRPLNCEYRIFKRIDPKEFDQMRKREP